MMRVSVRGQTLKDGLELQEKAVCRVRVALGRFADVVQIATLTVTDVLGPRCGPDKNARIVALLRPAQEVVAEATDAIALAAVDRACYRIERLVGRAVERRDADRAP
jgi:hypothetical protein